MKASRAGAFVLILYICASTHLFAAENEEGMSNTGNFTTMVNSADPDGSNTKG